MQCGIRCLLPEQAFSCRQYVLVKIELVLHGMGAYKVKCLLPSWAWTVFAGYHVVGHVRSTLTEATSIALGPGEAVSGHGLGRDLSTTSHQFEEGHCEFIAAKKEKSKIQHLESVQRIRH